jgi:hypothetical protein
MPCTGPDVDYPRVSFEYIEGCNVATRVACEYLGGLEAANLKIPAYAREWWEEHKELDRQREAEKAEHRKAKQIKNAAMKKLTKEERTALGLTGDLL